MVRVVKVKYRGGVLEPLGLEEGVELTVMIPALGDMAGADETIKTTAGAWAELLDCEAFEQELYANRLVNTRSEVHL
ncbi:MAG: hypothetical protein KatS3mg018_0410 [Fimbriimonadales bacterium]|nr:MAG: hypothetical protein KatS3mg018_0410 [Fimbriimonadales bacterium]